MATSNTYTDLREVYDQIKQTKFNDSDIVDILSNYPWRCGSGLSNTIDIGSALKSGSYTVKGNIPFCIAVEYEQTISSTLANLLALTSITADSISSVNSTIKAISGNDTAKSVLDKITSSNNVNDTMNKAENYLKEKLDDLRNAFVNNRGESSHLQGVLQPYNALYYTKATDKKFIFPYLAGDSILSVANNFTDTPKDMASSIREMLATYVEGLGSISLQLKNIIGATFGDKNKAYNEGFKVEMAKAYDYNVEGEEIKVSFPLYNTITPGAWKDNYKFIYLFLLRNLPMKTGLSTYLPPLLYDVLLPATKRLPLAFVSSFSATPQGMQRIMLLPATHNPTSALPQAEGKSGSIQVPIPEAWNIEITFKGLLSKSMNTFLSSYLDLNIEVQATVEEQTQTQTS